jgi:hypothetical protein
MLKRSNEAQERRDNDGLHRRRGIWEYALTINGQRRSFSAGTRNYKEARKIRANAIKAQLENRVPTDAAKQRFETLLAQVLADRAPHLAENSIRIEKERSGPLLSISAATGLRNRRRRNPRLSDGSGEAGFHQDSESGNQGIASDPQSRKGVGNPRGRFQATEGRPPRPRPRPR